ncbi:hypothetical protein [Nostoc sp. NMS4]|uniref:hypothetical protein n=1 Tax=Nostoc sp. NMS4 TaxID=2815390 RepID=UPI0025D03A35|nr:hypothetical protein [Nostoc sp. NMS4]
MFEKSCCWIFYAVLNDLCADVALQQPIERSFSGNSQLMLVFFPPRTLTKPTTTIYSLVEHQRSMGLVKAVRQRH